MTNSIMPNAVTKINQYSMPVKKTKPVIYPNQKDCLAVLSLSAIKSGTKAIQANTQKLFLGYARISNAAEKKQYKYSFLKKNLK